MSRLQSVKLYAARRSRAIRQACYDLLTIAWVTAWIWLGIDVHHQVSGSKDGARKIEKSGGDLARHLHDAAGVLSHTPLVGKKVRQPIDKSADAATSLQHAGGELADNLGNLGAAIGFEIALVPVLVAVFGWLFLRVGYARRAGRANALRRLPGGPDLLALAALTRLPARSWPQSAHGRSSTGATATRKPSPRWRSPIWTTSDCRRPWPLTSRTTDTSPATPNGRRAFTVQTTRVRHMPATAATMCATAEFQPRGRSQ